MQLQGAPLPKVDVKALFDNNLLKTIEAEGFLDKIKSEIKIVTRESKGVSRLA